MMESEKGYLPEEFAARLPEEKEEENFIGDKTVEDTDRIRYREVRTELTEAEYKAVLDAQSKIFKFFNDERPLAFIGDKVDLEELFGAVLLDTKLADPKDDLKKWKYAKSTGFRIEKDKKIYHVGVLVNEDNEIALDSVTI